MKFSTAIYWILGMSLLLRLAGIGYGLPLWLISDEPPFTAATLKMIELKTALPVLHEEVFKKLIYFPPYLSYAYLVPFGFIMGFQYLFFEGNLNEFKNYVISDPSALFIFVRLFNVILGVATVYLTYRITHNIFKSTTSALLSAFFLGTSILHIDLSMVGRDWVPVIFLFALSLFYLSDDTLSFRRRYFIGALISGIAFGVSLMAGFSMVFMLFWYLCFERHTILESLKEKDLYFALAIFLVLAGVSVAVFPFGFVFSKYTSAGLDKSISELFYTLYYFFIPIFKSEPILVAMSAFGLVFAYKHLRNYFWTITFFVLTYASMFYLTYHYHPRFTAFLFPVLAGLAGYGAEKIMLIIKSKLIARSMLAVILVFPLISSATFSRLAFLDDSRAVAREWFEKNIPENSKVLVEARLLRLTSNRAGIEEQKMIDPNSLRQVDFAELAANVHPKGYPRFHALNLYTVDNGNFFASVDEYSKRHGYKYLVLDPHMEGEDPDRIEKLRELAKKGRLLAEFGGSSHAFALETGEFGNIFGLMRVSMLGPKIQIFSLESSE